MIKCVLIKLVKWIAGDALEVAWAGVRGLFVCSVLLGIGVYMSATPLRMAILELAGRLLGVAVLIFLAFCMVWHAVTVTARKVQQFKAECARDVTGRRNIRP